MQRCCSQAGGGGGGDETLRREGERERGATLPCGCALPHIADAAFESLGGVPEGAHATVPVAFIRGLFGVSFWPYKLNPKREKKQQQKKQNTNMLRSSLFSNATNVLCKFNPKKDGCHRPNAPRNKISHLVSLEGEWWWCCH